jgi:transcriptional regulator of arginine metabolism
MNGRRGGAPNARIATPSAAMTFPASVPGSPAAVRAPVPATISPAALKSARQRAIRELVARSAIASQQDLVDALRARGMDVTQATVSRDVAELGLVKITRGERHIYVSAADLAAGGAPTSDALLRRLLADIPVRVGRSGLTLVLTSAPGTASSIAQAIDQSTLTDQEGTLAGDNTLLVLFADDGRLERWLERFRAIGPVTPTAAITAISHQVRIPEVSRS